MDSDLQAFLNDLMQEIKNTAPVDQQYKDLEAQDALVQACGLHDLEKVKMLLANGADPNDQSEGTGMTPLHWACSTVKNLGVIECLLTAGANPNLQDVHGQTPLIRAAWETQSGEHINKLISFGAVTDLTDVMGETALIKATFRGNVKNVQHLIAAGANLDIANQDGDTALMIAASKNHLEIVRLLINAGACLDLINTKSYTATDIAHMNGHADVHQELQQAQAMQFPDGTVKKISYDDLDISGDIGKGGFSSVYKGKWKSREMTVAIKNIMGVMRGKEVGKVEILNQLDHPNIIQFYGIAVQTPDYFIVLEFMENGSLYEIIHKKQSYLDLEQGLQLAKDIAEGMKYLHGKKVIHRDLKSSNARGLWYTAKEIDHTTVHTDIGTPRWMAPEVLRKEPVSLSCDVYSYGMVLLEIFTHKLPYAEIEAWQISEKVLAGEAPLLPDTCPPYLAELMHKCWKNNPKVRPTFDEILSLLVSKDIKHGHDVNKDQKVHRVLTVADLPVLQSHLQSVTDLWYPIGIGLQLNPSVLRSIAQSAGGDPSTSLMMVVKHWLEDEVSPTAQCLADCLVSPSVDEEELAHALLQEF